MSYGRDRVQLSECTTEWLDAHRYFNTSETYFDHPAQIKMLPPVAYSPDTIRLCFEVTDTDGLHQAQLIIPTTAADPTDGVKLHGCKSLDSGINLIKFFTTELTPARGSEVSLRVIDGHGNFTQEWYPIRARDIVPDISTEYLLSVPAGISLIHVPLEVTSVKRSGKKDRICNRPLQCTRRCRHRQLPHHPEPWERSPAHHPEPWERSPDREMVQLSRRHKPRHARRSSFDG